MVWPTLGSRTTKEQNRTTGLSWVPLQLRTRRRRFKEVKVQQSVSTVRLHTHCSGDSWSCGRGGVRLYSGTGTPHLQPNCRATLIFVLDATSQRCCALWERHLYHRDCTVNQQRCLTLVFQFECCLYRV